MLKIQDVMTTTVKSCVPEDNLARVAMEMWDADCGVIPVVDSAQKVVSVVTDRDICMAAATKHRKPEEILVKDVVRQGAFTCMPGDDVHRALEIMAAEKIRRLPVVDEEGRLTGMVSMNDIVLAAKGARGKKGVDLALEDVVDTLKSICAHRWPAVVAA